MSLPAVITDRLERSFGLYRDLLEMLDTEALSSKLPGLPSNTVGLQLWCVVGARESYTRAIQANAWSGFACSLTEVNEKTSVAASLSQSAQACADALREIVSFSDTQNRLLVDLLEHEAAHQGQLIRYLYGLRLRIPESWKARYALTQDS